MVFISNKNIKTLPLTALRFVGHLPVFSLGIGKVLGRFPTIILKPMLRILGSLAFNTEMIAIKTRFFATC